MCMCQQRVAEMSLVKRQQCHEQPLGLGMCPCNALVHTARYHQLTGVRVGLKWPNLDETGLNRVVLLCQEVRICSGTKAFLTDF